MKKRFFVVAAVIISSQLQAQLQQDTIGQSLDEVILTASKYPKKQSETGKVVTVINRQQLERSSGKTLSELLNTVAGTTVIGANNNLGTNQTVSIRGASAGNTLILVDGIPVNDPSVNTNYFDLNLLSIDQIERIEILKGGQSTLYGSDAVAGVINIILKKAGTQKLAVNGIMAGGSYNTFRQNIGFSGRQKGVTHSTNYTHLHSDGFSAAYDASGNGRFDKDGIDQHAVNTRWGFRPGDRLQATVFGTYNYYKTDLDASAFTDEKDYTVKNDNVQAGAGWIYTHKRGALHFNYAFNYVQRSYLDDSTFKSLYTDFSKSRYIGRTHYAELYNSWKWNQWELLAGIDYRMNNTDQVYFSTGMFGPYAPDPLVAKMSQISPYASAVYKNSGFTLELGGRWNHHSEYGSNFTYTLNPSYLIGGKVKVFANLYSAFKAPTLYQLFDLSAGNPDLTPEKSIIGEVGAELFAAQSFRLRVTGFYRHTNDAILYTSNPVTFASLYRNVSEQTNSGLEAEANYTTGKWSIVANYTYTDGETKAAFDGTGAPLSKDTTYYNLYRIPKHALNLNIGIQATKALFASVQLRSVSKREEFIYGATPEPIKAYATVDLYTEYKFDSRFKAFIDLKNITDKKYFEYPGYNSRRFNFMAGVNFHL